MWGIHKLENTPATHATLELLRDTSNTFAKFIDAEDKAKSMPEAKLDQLGSIADNFDKARMNLRKMLPKMSGEVAALFNPLVGTTRRGGARRKAQRKTRRSLCYK